MATRPGKKALITGGSGFAGFHLFECLAPDWEVTLLDLGDPPDFLAGRGEFAACDIRSLESLREVLVKVKPDVIYHLAGIAFVPAAEKDKNHALSVNLRGGECLFQAVLETIPEARVIVISSSEVYGKAGPEEMPLKEETALKPANYYAFTKAALEAAAHYAGAKNLNFTILRPFNHIGPRQADLFVTSAFARQVARAESGKIPPIIKVGNLEAVRDFTDVEDIVRAYRAAGSMPLKHATYNLSSGKGVKIREILDGLLQLAAKEIRVEQDPARLRPSDMPVLIGDNTRFCSETGWQPQVPLEESLRRILDYWRSQA
ncbi:MAG: GDP-mannose 4,6-dehydratase [Planctomycetota bacterium]|jgi:GDP-4-dehydro-6-deoxy-D-mannose reductase